MQSRGSGIAANLSFLHLWAWRPPLGGVPRGSLLSNSSAASGPSLQHLPLGSLRILTPFLFGVPACFSCCATTLTSGRGRTPRTFAFRPAPPLVALHSPHERGCIPQRFAFGSCFRSFALPILLCINSVTSFVLFFFFRLPALPRVLSSVMLIRTALFSSSHWRQLSFLGEGKTAQPIRGGAFSSVGQSRPRTHFPTRGMRAQFPDAVAGGSSLPFRDFSSPGVLSLGR
jgi:hypothetical protein